MPTLSELRKGIAKDLDIKGRWKMNKQELEEAILVVKNQGNVNKKPVPKPRTIFPEGVRPIPKPRNTFSEGVRPITKPRNVSFNKIDKPLPKPRKRESWLDWFIKKLRRVGEGLIYLIPEGKVKDMTRKLLNLINKEELLQAEKTKSSEKVKRQEPEVKEYFRGRIKNIRIRGRQQMDIPSFFKENRRMIIEKIQGFSKPFKVRFVLTCHYKLIKNGKIIEESIFYHAV